MLKPRPWWLFFIPGDAWVTLAPYIYHPKTVVPEARPQVIAHENEHLDQQEKLGVKTWVWRYSTSRSFRLDQEARGVAREILFLEDHGLSVQAITVRMTEAKDLASGAYLWAASSPEVAEREIRKYETLFNNHS